MGIDLDKWIEKVRKTEYLAEDELKALCDYVRQFTPSSGFSLQTHKVMDTSLTC